MQSVDKGTMNEVISYSSNNNFPGYWNNCEYESCWIPQGQLSNEVYYNQYEYLNNYAYHNAYESCSSNSYWYR